MKTSTSHTRVLERIENFYKRHRVRRLAHGLRKFLTIGFGHPKFRSFIAYHCKSRVEVLNILGFLMRCPGFHPGAYHDSSAGSLMLAAAEVCPKWWKSSAAAKQPSNGYDGVFSMKVGNEPCTMLQHRVVLGPSRFEKNKRSSPWRAAVPPTVPLGGRFDG